IAGKAGLCFFNDQLEPGALVAKLSPTGELLYLYTFGGGLANTSTGTAIAIDAQGNAYVTGTTSRSQFSTPPGAFHPNYCARFLSHGFVANVNPAGAVLVYSTYLCGDAYDSPNSIAVDANGNAYIAGGTVSHNFPIFNAYQSTHRNSAVGTTGFLCKLNA